MRRAPCVLIVGLGLASFVSPASSQATRGVLLLEAEPGYLTNAYLGPGFAVWDPGVETAFGAVGSTGLLEWTGERSSLSVRGTARWTAFTDATDGWQAYRLGVGGDRDLSSTWDAGLQLSLSEFRQTTDQRAVWLQGRTAWTITPRLRLSAGPGLAYRRFPGSESGGDPPGGPPSGPPGGFPPPAPGEETLSATSYLGFLGIELWAGSAWRLEGRLFGSHTEMSDLGLEYRGAGGTFRATRWLPGGGTLGVGAGIEGFGYRAASTDADTASFPGGDVLWSGELTWTHPLGSRTELRARLAGLSAGNGTEPTATGGVFDYGASLGLRVALGGRLDAAVRTELWSRTESGALTLRVPYDGPGQIYLVGDFNGWASPGTPLRPTERGVREVTLTLEPGIYRYRLRLVEADGERWFPLPEGAETESDGFGGENGVLIVGARRGNDEDGR